MIQRVFARPGILLFSTLLLCQVPGSAQERPRLDWVPSLGVTSTTSNGATGTTVGLRAGVLASPERGLGFDFGLGYYVPQFPSYAAVATDFGMVHRMNRRSTELVLAAGGTVLLNANGSGEAAPHLKLGALHVLSGRMAIRADVVGRYWARARRFGAGLDGGLLWLRDPPEQAERRVMEHPPIDGWVVGAAAGPLALRQREWDLSFWGPSLSLARINPGALGFETALWFIVPTGRYDFTGVSLDLGLVHGLTLGSSSTALLRLGATALVGGDSDGTGGGSGAVYAGVGLVQRLVGPLSLRLDLTPRVWVLETTSITFGGSAGLAWVR